MANEDKLREYLRLVTEDLQNTRRRLETMEVRSREPLAITGIACRYPGGVRTPEDLWRLVDEGTDAIAPFPTDRGWDLDALYDENPDTQGTSYVREGGFLYDAGDFDAELFGISPREALAMDPQQRLLLQASWEALESAGVPVRSLRGTDTGVFVGAGPSNYLVGMETLPDGVEAYALTGNVGSVISGRVSYAFGLEGPGVTIDTACSSSLVALHLAARGLRAGECSMALVGGVTLFPTPRLFVDFSRQRGLAPDGRCKPFAAAADGTAWAEGVAMLVLERLSTAERNGRPIWGVLRGSAINQDGASSGLTAPNGPSQQRVIEAALDDARVSAAQVDMVEAHGTGTVLGDPIEVQALQAVYGADRPEGRPLRIGSVKSNIGHSAAAAGLAGVIKNVMAMRRGTMPRTLHVDRPTPHVDWSRGTVSVLTEPVPWPRGEQPRLAAVSAFGISGTNAHVILEEAPPRPESPPAAVTPQVPWVLSAHDEESLRARAKLLRAHVRTDGATANGALDGDAAHTAERLGWSLATTRSHLTQRAVLTGAGTGPLLAGLDALGTGAQAPGLVTGTPLATEGVGFLFPGQGSQWPRMGVELLDTFPVFAEKMAECDAALRACTDWSLIDVLRGSPGSPDLSRVDVVQPALFAVMVSLAELWMSWGVEPVAVVGHSQGEIAAACVAGALSLDDAAKVAAVRSRALVRLAGQGGMAVIGLPERQVRELGGVRSGEVSIAAVNGPASTVVSGAADALAALVESCGRDGVWARTVAVDYASHSPQVEAIRTELLTDLAGITPLSPRIAFQSTVTGEAADATAFGPEYWYDNLRLPVRFAEVARALIDRGVGLFVETSPHPVLTGAVADIADEAAAEVAAVGTLRKDDGGPDRFLTSLSEAFVKGAPVDFSRAFRPGDGPAAELPGYPFRRQRYWLTPRPPARAGAGAEADAWHYRVRWTACEPRAESPGGDWALVLPVGYEGHAWPTACAGLLGERGRMVPLEVDPATADRAGLTARLAELGPVRGVLSLLALDDRPPHDGADSSGAVSPGLAGTVLLAQALADSGLDAPLWCATSGAVRVADTEPLPNPAQAQVWGLGRAVSVEEPRLWGGLVDLPTDADPAAVRRLAGVLAGAEERAEADAGADGRENEVAVRGHGVFARRLARTEAASDSPPWQPRGTVLVTGGSGAIGARVARWLLSGGAEHVVLLGRRGPDAPGAARLVQELGAVGGGRVSVVACDVTDWDAVARLVETLTEQGERIRGVFHTAARVELAPLREITPEHLSLVLSAKTDGARNLHELVDTDDLDTMVFFSSATGVWGSADHGAYGAANAHLDALAEHRRARGLPAASIAWGVWDAANDHDGAADSADRARLTERARRQGLPPMDPDRALTEMGRVLGAGTATGLVADVRWDRLASLFAASGTTRLFSGIAEAAEQTGTPAGPSGSAGSAFRDRLAPMSAEERTKAIEELVRTRAAATLGYPDARAVQPGRAFRDVGFDSVMAVELRNALTADTGLRLPATLAFDHPTPAAVARHLAAELYGGTDGAAEGAEPAAGRRTDPDEPLAIVGMACRYPGGVGSPEDLWRVLESGTDAVTGLPADRGWDLENLYAADPDAEGKSYARGGGFLADATGFDAPFFGISPREALAMDPQQRLLLEVSWEAVESAGIDPATLHGTATATYIGANQPEYGLLGEWTDSLEGHVITGSNASVLSGRVAYCLGLEGAALTIETACSSSLVALHVAGQALRAGECDRALVGGVAVMSTPMPLIEFSRQRGLAADGRCKAFGDGADGMGLAEGVAVLVVERLSDARRQGHRVLAVLRGSAVNQDGASNGLTAPNGPSQERVIRAALAAADIGPSDVDIVEAHGTGTRLGDPIEAQALLATYGRDRAPDRPLWVGSVKSNIGHSQAAAGLAGVIKAVQALRHRTLPATLHADPPTAEVDWSSGGVRPLLRTVPWEVPDGRVRRVGVSSFGMSGTNAHVILEEATPVPDEEAAAQPALAPGSDAEAASGTPSRSVTAEPGVLGELPVVPWAFSGRGTAALRAQAGRLADFATAAAADGDTPALADAARELVRTRTPFESRAVAWASEPGTGATGTCDMADVLRRIATGPDAREDQEGAVTGQVVAPDGVVWVFPGQGGQWPGMAAGLLASSPVFAESIARCEQALSPHIDWSLNKVLEGADDAWIGRVDIVQPALWAVMVSLAELWRACGVTPAAVVGHSQGEIAAACVAGVLSLEDGARIVAARSRLVAGVGGTMALVSAPPEAIADLATDPAVCVAAANGPAEVIVAGPVDAVESLLAACEREGVHARRVAVDYAAHSAAVESVRDELLAELAAVAPRPATVPMYSTVTSAPLDGPECDAAYWYANLRDTVAYAPAIAALAARGHRVFCEVSPHPVLVTSTENVLLDQLDEDDAYAVLDTLRRNEGGPVRFLTALARAWVRGTPVDFTTLLPRPPVPVAVDLPTYAFQHERYWLAAHTPATDDWLYEERWLPYAPPHPGDQGALAGTWLCVVPRDAADAAVREAAALCERAVTEHGGRVVPVEVGDDELSSPDALAAAIRTATDGDITGILSLLGLDERPMADGHVSHGTAGTLHLVRALSASRADDPGTPGRLWCLTCAAAAVADGDVPSPMGAQVCGLARVAALEESGVWRGLIDLPASSGPESTRALAAALADTTGEDQFAVRGDGVLIRRVERAADPAAGAAPATMSGPADTARGGAVLLVGPAVPLAGPLARWFATRGAGHVVLVDAEPPAEATERALRADLAAQGTELTVAACDLADRVAAEDLAGQLKRQGTVIRTVVHAQAGGELASVRETTPGLLARMAAPRAAAVEHLLGLLDPGALDAVVLFGSVTGVWGAGRHAAYAAANAQLDALAAQWRTRGLPAVSVAWGVWDSEELTDPTARDALRVSVEQGLPLLRPERALSVLGRVLDSGRERPLVVADVDWERFVPLFTSARPSRLFETVTGGQATGETAGEDDGGALRARLGPVGKDERRRILRALVRTEAAEALGHQTADAVGPTRTFSDLGFESLTAVALRNRLSRATGLRLPSTVVFDHATPAILGDHLLDLLAEDLPDQSEQGASSHEGALAQLRELEKAFADSPPEGELRDSLARRLRNLLWTCTDGAPGAAGDDAHDEHEDLESATAGEIFDLLDRELGTP